MYSQKAEKPTSQSIESMISNFYPRPIPAILFWRPAKNLYESQAWPSLWYWQIFKILEIIPKHIGGDQPRNSRTQIYLPKVVLPCLGNLHKSALQWQPALRKAQCGNPKRQGREA